jgi:hypothetical protein
MLDVTLMFLLEEAHRDALFARPKFQVHRRREAVRGGKLIRPTLARSVSDQGIKTWPGANRPRRVCKWDIHRELEDLVTASTSEDTSDEEDDDEVPHRPLLSQRGFLSTDSWQRKGEREMGRERRAKSDGSTRRPELV